MSWCFTDVCVFYCLSRSCLANNNPPLQSPTLIFLLTQSSGRKATLRRNTQEVQTVRRMARQQRRAMALGKGLSLRAIKTPANSSVETPGLTTMTPGINSLSSTHRTHFSFCCVEDKNNHLCFACGRLFIRHHHLYNQSVSRHVWGQLYCPSQAAQVRSYHQDPSSTVGGLTAEDIEKARQNKNKPHKQMVTFIPRFLSLNTDTQQCVVYY